MIFNYLFVCLFVCLFWPSHVSVEAYMRDLVPRPEMETGPPPLRWEHGVLATGPPGKSQKGILKVQVLPTRRFVFEKVEGRKSRWNSHSYFPYLWQYRRASTQYERKTKRPTLLETLSLPLPLPPGEESLPCMDPVTAIKGASPGASACSHSQCLCSPPPEPFPSV